MELKLPFLMFQILFFRQNFAESEYVADSSNEIDHPYPLLRPKNFAMEIDWSNTTSSSENPITESLITDIICEKYQFQCTDGSCIENDDICDKNPDCPDGLDEGDICLSNTGSKKRGYGEFCNKQLKCNSTNWFNCLENRCECAKPDEMTYDLDKGKCLALLNEKCKFEIGKVGDLGQYALYEMIGCITNSACSSDGFCKCLPDFEESDEGFCTEKSNYTEYCKSQSNCKESQFLDCIDGSCVCSNISIWRDDLNVCVGLAGQNCIDKKCTENSYCNFENKCTCSKGFYKDENGTCSAKKSHLENCTNSEECLENEHLICSDKGVCDCNSEYSIWRSDYKSCVGIAENQCINIQCIVGAKCYKSQEKYDGRNTNSYTDNDYHYSNYGYYFDKYGSRVYSRPQTESPFLTKSPDSDDFKRAGICKCSDNMNFLRSKDKSKCWPEHGKICSKENPCDPDFFVCKNNICSCPSPYHQEYIITGICSSFPGGPCVMEHSVSSSSCRGNSECVLNKFNESNCECKKGYIEVSSGDCKLSYGEMCESTSDCENVTPLECINGFCSCADKLTRYDENSKKCLSLIGAKCTISEDNCVENAFCDQDNVSVKGRCVCKNGYIANKHRICELIFSGN